MTYILGIESSCDDTSAAVLQGNTILSNVIASQAVHAQYGGIIPELASREHQKNILPVVDVAIKRAGIQKGDLSAIAFTNGPGLIGSLLVGCSFAKGLSIACNTPLIEVNHLHGHVLSHFMVEPNEKARFPEFPFICLLVSGGNSQLIVVKDHYNMEIIGTTIDDAAGEAFDKCAKLMGLPYPGGHLVDKLAKEGNPHAFSFSKPNIPDLNYSFSGLKTSFLYFLRDKTAKDKQFIEQHKADLCASLQKTIIDILLEKLIKAVKKTGIKEVALAGGVSANSGLQQTLKEIGDTNNWQVYIPKRGYTTDNAAMIATVGYYKYQQKMFADHSVVPYARVL